MFSRVCLVSVGGSEGFWATAGYRAHREIEVAGSYGPQAVYMSKSVEVDQLAASPR
jgi:hypothetical protein